MSAAKNMEYECRAELLAFTSYVLYLLRKTNDEQRQPISVHVSDVGRYAGELGFVVEDRCMDAAAAHAKLYSQQDSKLSALEELSEKLVFSSAEKMLIMRVLLVDAFKDKVIKAAERDFFQSMVSTLRLNSYEADQLRQEIVELYAQAATAEPAVKPAKAEAKPKPSSNSVSPPTEEESKSTSKSRYRLFMWIVTAFACYKFFQAFQDPYTHVFPPHSLFKTEEQQWTWITGALAGISILITWAGLATRCPSCSRWFEAKEINAEVLSSRQGSKWVTVTVTKNGKQTRKDRKVDVVRETIKKYYVCKCCEFKWDRISQTERRL